MGEGITKREVNAYEVGPCPDVAEFSVGAVAEVDVTLIGGYPVRGIKILAGSGTLQVRTARSGAVNRPLTVAAGDTLEFPGQFSSIRGSADGTTGVTSIRVWK